MTLSEGLFQALQSAREEERVKCRDNFTQILDREVQSAHAQGVREGMERAAKAARSAIDRHRPDASFDDSQAGTAERNALLTNVADEVEAAIQSQKE